MNSHLRTGIYIDEKTKKAIFISNQPPIENLVFEGGGVKEMATVGVISTLEDYHMLQSVKRVAGSSAGSITALFLALGCNAKQIDEYNKKIELSSLIHSPSNKSMKQSVVENRMRDASLTSSDLDDGSLLINKINDIIRDKLTAFLHDHPEHKKEFPSKTENFTFRHLALLGKYDPTIRDLVITGTRLYEKDGKQKSETIYFNAQNTPDLPISKAIRMSTAIPYFFQGVEIQDKELLPGNYLPPGIYVDGGVLNNYPMNVFDKNKDTANPNTLGVQITSKDDAHNVLYQYDKELKRQKKLGNKIEAFFMNKLLHADAMGAIHSMNADIHNKYALRTIMVEDQGVKETDFHVTEKVKVKMIASAKNKTDEWVKNYMCYSKNDSFADMCQSMDVNDLWLLRKQLLSGEIKIYISNFTDEAANSKPLNKVSNPAADISEQIAVINTQIRNKTSLVSEVESKLATPSNVQSTDTLMSFAIQLKNVYANVIDFLKEKQKLDGYTRPSKSLVNNMLHEYQQKMDAISKLQADIFKVKDVNGLNVLLKKLNELVPENNKALQKEMNNLLSQPDLLKKLEMLQKINAPKGPASILTGPVRRG